MAHKFIGDTGKFRQALLSAGFVNRAKSTIFNDNSKAKPQQPTRRLKLWFADDVFSSPQKKQKKLEKALRELFGDRIIKMYFTHSPSYGAQFKSLCIKLKDI